MLTNPLISVIVPIYNAEMYLDRCVNSILTQTYSNLEIILIDDGSFDQSFAICDSFAEKDHRVIVRHTLNRGVSAARNEGIGIAKGSYLSFVDSDDYLDVTTYDKLYSKVVDTNAQVVWSDFCQVNNEKHYYIKSFAQGNNKHETISNLIVYGPNGGPPWNYLLIKASLIKENKLLFPTNYNLGEDFWFGLRLHIYSSCSCKVEEPLYYYEISNLSSITHIEKGRQADKVFSCLKESYMFLKDKGFFEEFKQEISWRLLLAKTSWVMSPSSFSDYYSNIPEVNKYVDNNPLLGHKMKIIMKLLNNKKTFMATILVAIYKLINKQRM